MMNWTELDQKRLQIAYDMSASLKVIGLALNRTPTAISKALTRFGIRPLGACARGIKKGTLQSGAVTCKQVLREFDRRLGTNSHMANKSNPSQENSHATSSLTYSKDSVKMSLGWVSFDAVIRFLKEEGYQVSECNKKLFAHDQADGDYLLNQRPYRVEQLLMIANRVRFINGKDPFLVAGITQ